MEKEVSSAPKNTQKQKYLYVLYANCMKRMILWSYAFDRILFNNKITTNFSKNINYHILPVLLSVTVNPAWASVHPGPHPTRNDRPWIRPASQITFCLSYMLDLLNSGIALAIRDPTILRGRSSDFIPLGMGRCSSTGGIWYLDLTGRIGSGVTIRGGKAPVVSKNSILIQYLV